jgi:single-stranded DNA-specific DHH superfamily exonuclease
VGGSSLYPDAVNKGDQTVEKNGAGRSRRTDKKRTSSDADVFTALHKRLNSVSRLDQKRLGRRVKGARKITQADRQATVISELETRIDKAEKQLARRHPRLHLPARTSHHAATPRAARNNQR